MTNCPQMFVYVPHSTSILHMISVASIAVLLDKSDNVKICDFGLSQLQQSSMTSNMAHTAASRGHAGTDVYKALNTWDPEEGDIDEKSDIYSFGILIHELFVGTIPWADRTREMLLTLHVLKKKSPPPDKAFEQKYPKIAKIFEQCCRHDRKQRPAAIALLRSLRAITSGE